nr:cyclic AMP-responsive element-binding protein 3-like protein 4 [Danio rerio]|eukprot:XP_021322460.1 cyclic AMP-responsive element-binding protein 3-like protein 4 [Danio rerio]
MQKGEFGSGDAKSTERDGFVEEVVASELLLDQSCPGLLFADLEKHTEDWSLQPHCSLNDSESEEVLNAINPNQMYVSAVCESDSGVSEDQSSDGAHEHTSSSASQLPVYQVVYDISGVGGASAEPHPPHVDVISIQLDEWSSQMLLSESCVVNELLSPVKTEDVSALDMQSLQEDDGFLVCVKICRISQAEERILKKVRRKIRNKLSAQDSRRRKKEYIDGLESRYTHTSDHSHTPLIIHTQYRRVHRSDLGSRLGQQNWSLVAQLHRLQALIKQTATKAAQTSTCLMILLFSLALLIFPSLSPFHRSSESLQDSYAPAAVISRNILNDVSSASSALLDDSVLHKPMIPPDPPSEQRAADLEVDERLIQDSVMVRESSHAQSNGSTESQTHTDLQPLAIAANTDKLPHADEM